MEQEQVTEQVKEVHPLVVKNKQRKQERIIEARARNTERRKASMQMGEIRTVFDLSPSENERDE